jgi:hypothetical protein
MSSTFLIQNGDVVKSASNSRPAMIANGQKLNQDLNEAANIRTQPNGFGFGLQDLIGQVSDTITLRSNVNRRIRDGIEAMKSLQGQYQSSQRPDNERLSRLTLVQVNPLTTGIGSVASTAFSFQFAVTTAAGDQLVSTGVITSGT